jgi:hypothetical protein
MNPVIGISFKLDRKNSYALSALTDAKVAALAAHRRRLSASRAAGFCGDVACPISPTYDSEFP